MKIKVKKVLFHNIGLKILAVLFALALWFMVVNVDDPSQTKSFTVNVQVENANVLDESGEYYTIPEGESTVTFRVTANRSVLEALSASDFTAVADMNYLDHDKSRIPIEITANKYTSKVSIASKQYYLNVTIGSEKSAKFIITPQTQGTPAEGSAIDEVSVTPNVLQVTGPADIVSSISSVTATCDVSGMSTDITESVVPKIYDAKGKLIDTTNLQMNLSTVDVAVTMVSVKDVAIQVQTSGTPLDGLALDKITTSPETISIKGEAKVLNDISMITIPASVVDLSNATKSFDTSVDITTYLPDGVTLEDASETQVTISVALLSKESRTYKISTANLTINGLSSGLTGQFDGDTITAEVTGFASDLDKLKASEITGFADANQLTEGTHTVNVTLNLDMDTYQVGNVTAQLILTQSSD